MDAIISRCYCGKPTCREDGICQDCTDKVGELLSGEQPSPTWQVIRKMILTTRIDIHTTPENKHAE